MSELSENILKLYAEGVSYRQIEAQLGCAKSTIAYHCGVGQKAKTFKRERDRRGAIAKYVQHLKQVTPCADCGEDYPYWIMEFDHLGDKLFNISAASRRGHTLEQIKEEITKCEIVCANCHKNRTHTRGYFNGSNSMDVSEFYSM